MSLWQAFVLGLVEGLTEYLPVSSTGHLIVAQRLMGIPASDASNAYAIVIQAGAIAAVFVLYRQRLAQMVRGLFGRDDVGARVGRGLVVAFVPAAAIGLVAGDAIERALFGPWPIVGAWAVGGVVILVIGRRLGQAEGRPLDELSWRIALLVGVAQCLAFWPGVSRSLATILGGLAAGLSLVAAIELSFLLGLITLGAATAYAGLRSGEQLLAAYGAMELIVGFVVAWLAAMASIRWMISWLRERDFTIFGWWRLLAAAIVTVLLLWMPDLLAD